MRLQFSGCLFSQFFSNDSSPADFFSFFSKKKLSQELSTQQHLPLLLPIIIAPHHCQWLLPIAVARWPLPITVACRHCQSHIGHCLSMLPGCRCQWTIARWTLTVGRCPSAIAHRLLPVRH
jgi:hypothetical protein